MDRIGLRAFMNRQRYGVVSSLSTTGVPQSALVGIAASPELEIVFDTFASTRKYANLTQHPACSVVVGWSGEQTVQFEGVALLPTDTELKRLQQIYFEVWPDGADRLNRPGLVHFVIRPTWIRYSDYDQRPPSVQEFSFPPPRDAS